MIRYTPEESRLKIIELVVKGIIDKNNYSYLEAQSIVKESSFYEMTTIDIDYIEHYDISYWVDDVLKEKLLLNMMYLLEKAPKLEAKGNSILLDRDNPDHVEWFEDDDIDDEDDEDDYE